MVAKRKGTRSDLNIEDLATAIHAILRIHPVGAEETAIGRILGELRGLEGIGSATVGAATFGLFAFRISHGRKVVRMCAGGQKSAAGTVLKVTELRVGFWSVKRHIRARFRSKTKP
jgi:hypothetical protein